MNKTENKKEKDPALGLKEAETVMCWGNGLISKGFERTISRAENEGYVRVKFEVEWCGYLIQKDFQKIMDEALNQISGFLFSNEDGE